MAYCSYCGAEASADSAYCSNCGKPISPPGGATRAPATPPYPSPRTAPAPQVVLPWSGALMPQSGESVCRFWPADHEVSRLGVVDGRRQPVKVRMRGYLVLTTNRVVFIQERGVFAKSYHIDFDVPLEEIRGLSMGGLVMKYVSLSGPGGENVLHVRGVASDAEFAAFSGVVQGQLRSRQKAMEAEKRRGRVQIVLDFGFLREYMSKGGLSMQVVKCPACGAPMSLPSEGSQVKCAHCGSTIFAQDVMEKVKELIG